MIGETGSLKNENLQIYWKNRDKSGLYYPFSVDIYGIIKLFWYNSSPFSRQSVPLFY